MGASLLRLRSDEQLVALFRAGHDEAFRAIHDRYRQRLFAYARQMLPGRPDAEDALQDVFVRAYASLRASDRQLALRAWLYRVAHNRCVDELRRPCPPPPDAMQFICSPIQDPIAQADQRESLRRLVADVRRLPEQQRSALLMRELEGMSYADLSEALAVTVPAVKSLLVRARLGLAQAMEARETACSEIREALVHAHDRRVRPNATARRHLRDCPGCCQFRRELRGVSRQLAALSPAIGPLGVLAKVLGVGGGAGGGAAASGGTAAVSGVAGCGGAFASAGALAGGAGHIATLIAATVVTAGSAVEIQGTITAPPARPAAHHARSARPPVLRLPSAGAASSVVDSPVATARAVIAAVAAPARGLAPSSTTVSSDAPAEATGVASVTARPAALSAVKGTAGGASTLAASKLHAATGSRDGSDLASLAASASAPMSDSTLAAGSPSSPASGATPVRSSGASTGTSGGPSASSSAAGQSSTPTDTQGDAGNGSASRPTTSSTGSATSSAR